MKKIIRALSIPFVVFSANMMATEITPKDHPPYVNESRMNSVMTKPLRPARKSKGHHKKTHKPMPVPTHGNTQTILEKAFADISGFGVAGHEEIAVIEAGGEPLYGEITYYGLQLILNDLNLTAKDVFYDFGCGVGKVVAYVFLTTPVKKAMGIELCKPRYLGAQKARKRLSDSGYVAKNRTLAFTFQDFTKADVNDATVAYVLCLSSPLMLKITKKLSKLKDGLRVISLKQLPDHESYGFKLTKSYKVPMSWMKTGSPVYLYTLTK